jgi:uncharacterized protein (TIGR02300 family)
MAIGTPSSRLSRSLPVAKAEWGHKRICQSCGARFYDLRRSPIECPKCGTVFDPEILVKARRPRTPTPAPAPVVVAPPPPVVAADEEPAAEIPETEEEEVIEDASELGEDEDDVAEVIENVEEKEGER